MKKKVLLACALLGVLMLGGCNTSSDKKLGTLSAPQEIIIQSDNDRSLIIFDEVPNAQYYHIYINNMSVTVKGDGSGVVEFDASNIITLPQKYSIKVKASAGKYYDSRFSDTYEYNHTDTLATPTLSIDGHNLNWNKVVNADFYDVLVTTYNPTVEEIYRRPINSFDFSTILTNVGEYSFKVCATSENAEHLTSAYSNQVRYTYNKTLMQPYNLTTSYNADSGETLLYFIADEGVRAFALNVNGASYNVDSNLLITQPFDNVYCIKLGSFVKQKAIALDCANAIEVSVQALATESYMNSSNFSNKINCEITAILPTPTLVTTVNNGLCTAKIMHNSKEYAGVTYLGGFALYLDDVNIKNIESSQTQIDLPITLIGTQGLRVQAISNNNNCDDSNMSNVQYIDSSLTKLGSINITYSTGVVAWNEVENATKYVVEISNKTIRYADIVQADEVLEVNLSDICTAGTYTVTVIAMAPNYQQSDCSTTVNYVQKLETPSDVNITTIADITYLNFDEVDGAEGYVIYVNGVQENELYQCSPINLNRYISDTNSYNIAVQAIHITNSSIQDSSLSNEFELETVKALTKPTLSIIDGADGRYYLNVTVEESEKSMAEGCEIWINYTSLGVKAYEDAQIDITSLFSTAGVYNFKAKAIAKTANTHIKDSAMASITRTIKKQLNVVQNIVVTELETESKYILEFDEQTLAAKYLVNIIKADDESFNVEFEINSGYADITGYVMENGIYKIYVKALAIEGGYYQDSATTGNPARLVKGYTLPSVNNIRVDKNGEMITARWDAVENSLGYEVNIYYTSPIGERVLKKMIDSQTNSIELNNTIVAKEGDYSIQVKAIGDGELYESGQASVYAYKHTMETLADFTRNKVFMYGGEYNYQITDLNDLKHLLWYHYLYNNEVWSYNSSLEYNLKVYCSTNVQTLAQNYSTKYSTNLAEEIQDIESNINKMTYVATKFLEEYPEIASYSLGIDGQAFCLSEKTSVFMFRYENKLNDNKLESVATTNKMFESKIDEISDFDKRSSNYVFAIDKRDSIDVTTSEQLFMAVQYGKSPNFVGDSAVAEAIYANAKFLLRQICTDKMSHYEKASQIFDLLNSRVVYNNSITFGAYDEDIGSGVLRGNVKDFYLEGVLYNSNNPNGLFTNMNEFSNITAVSEGLSKAYTLLCAIEGVNSIKVNGKFDGVQHSWNKVSLNLDGVDGDEWYAVDMLSSRADATISNVSTQVATHNYFLVTDALLTADLNAQITTWHKILGEEDKFDGISYKAEKVYDYYEKDMVTANYTARYVFTNEQGRPQVSIVKESINVNHKATTEEGFKPLIAAARINGNNIHKVVVEIDVTGTNSNVETIKANMTNSYINNANNFFSEKGLSGQYLGSFTVTSVGNIIVLCFVPKAT